MKYLAILLLTPLFALADSITDPLYAGAQPITLDTPTKQETAQFDQSAFSPTTIALEAVTDGLLMIDKIQTERIKAHGMFEVNPWLSVEPSQPRIKNYFLGVAVLHAVGTYFMPQDYRIAWQSIFIGLETGVISINHANGLGL